MSGVEPDGADEFEAVWVCPGCGAETDPYSNICGHCRYVHLGRLRPEPEEPDGGSEQEDAGEEEVIEAVDPEARTSDKDPLGPLLFTFICPNPSCQRQNRIHNEDHNVCFNCGAKMFLNPEEREARWYEEAGRRRHDDGETTFLIGLGLCLVVFLGFPFVIEGISDMRRGTKERRRGREMNKAAGRGSLMRTQVRWIEMGTRAVDVPIPLEGPRPRDYDFEDAAWFKSFRRAYFWCWLVVVVIALIATVRIH